jgi:uncharacterized protein (TIGR02452 family)
MSSVRTSKFDRPPKHAGRGTQPSRPECVKIAKATLAACEARHYVNPAGEVVQLGELIDAARAGTTLLELGDALPKTPPPRWGRSWITVTNETTIAALQRLLVAGGHVACLNFASAHNPGSGFLHGAVAQEESLARSSALYPCLREQLDYYHRNHAHRSALYLDLAIFSPDVPFVRDDSGAWLARPACASVITCAAPNARALRQQGRFDPEVVDETLRRRAAFVLAIAAKHRVDRLVLGAWGTGALGNDPRVVASVFRALLAGRTAFDEVVFAIAGGPGENLDAFTRAFSTA